MTNHMNLRLTKTSWMPSPEKDWEDCVVQIHPKATGTTHFTTLQEMIQPIKTIMNIWPHCKTETKSTLQEVITLFLIYPPFTYLFNYIFIEYMSSVIMNRILPYSYETSITYGYVISPMKIRSL